MKSLLRQHRIVAAALAVGVLATACASADPHAGNETTTAAFTPQPQDANAKITVWTDSTRLPSVQAYQKANPAVPMDIVTYDGSADGSTYLQTKVQLFDRTGSGWPAVLFAAPTDVTWPSQPPNPNAQAF